MEEESAGEGADAAEEEPTREGQQAQEDEAEQEAAEAEGKAEGRKLEVRARCLVSFKQAA